MTLFAYDSNGYLQSIADSGGRVTQFSIDYRGDLTAIQNPDGTTQSFDYDIEHLMLSSTDMKGYYNRF